MAKTKRKWIDLDYSSPNSLRAQDIPYDSILSIKDKINSIVGGEGGVLQWSPETLFEAENVIYHEEKLYWVPLSYTSSLSFETDLNEGNLILIKGKDQVISDWNEVDSQSLGFIKNKPNIPDSANEISYDNSSSGLLADNVQSGIDEINDKITNIDASSWESDGEGFIKPKDNNQVKVSNINGALDVNTFNTHQNDTTIHFEKTDIDYSDIQNIPKELFKQLSEDNGSPNGFVNPSINVNVGFEDTTRTFSISPINTEFVFWSSGNRFTKTTLETLVLDDISGNQYLYYNENGVLVKTNVFNLDIIVKYCFVAAIYWNVSQAKHILFAHEYRHTTDMGGLTHARLHSVNGFSLESGGAIGNLVFGDGSLDTHIQFSNELTTAWDEDAKFVLDPRIITDNISVYWKEGTEANPVWYVKEDSSFPVFIEAGNTLPSYNQLLSGNWQLTEMANNNHMLIHVACNNDLNRKFMVFLGQQNYGNSINNVRSQASEELNDLILKGMIAPEFRFLGTLIVQVSTGYTNTVKARFIQISAEEDYIDWREVTIVESNNNQKKKLIELDDTPNTYTGSATKILKVNDIEDSMEFVDLPDSSKWNNSIELTPKHEPSRTFIGKEDIDSGLGRFSVQYSEEGEPDKVTISGIVSPYEVYNGDYLYDSNTPDENPAYRLADDKWVVRDSFNVYWLIHTAKENPVWNTVLWANLTGDINGVYTGINSAGGNDGEGLFVSGVSTCPYGIHTNLGLAGECLYIKDETTPKSNVVDYGNYSSINGKPVFIPPNSGDSIELDKKYLSLLYARNQALSAYDEIYAGGVSDGSLIDTGWVMPFNCFIKKALFKTNNCGSNTQLSLYKNLNTRILSSTIADVESNETTSGFTVMIFTFNNFEANAGDTIRMALKDWCNYPSITLILEEK